MTSPEATSPEALEAPTATGGARALARSVTKGAPDASIAAMELLERFQPQTIGAAVGLVAAEGTLTVEAFDCIADAWATYRHVMHLSWD